MFEEKKHIQQLAKLVNELAVEANRTAENVNKTLKISNENRIAFNKLFRQVTSMGLALTDLKEEIKKINSGGKNEANR